MVLFILFILCIFFIFIYVQFHDLSHSVLLHEFSFLFWFSPFFSAVKHTCGKEAAHFTRNILDRISFSLMRVSKVQFVVQFCSIFLAISIARFSGFCVCGKVQFLMRLQHSHISKKSCWKLIYWNGILFMVSSQSDFIYLYRTALPKTLKLDMCTYFSFN